MEYEPDHYLEEYWKEFKQFIRKLKTEYKIINNYINLQDMCDNLNDLKGELKYVEIEIYIERYIAIIGWVLIKNYNSYYFNLLKTQISRWKRIPSMILEQNKYVSKSNFKHLVDISFDMYLNLILGLSSSDEYYMKKYMILLSKLNIPDYNDNDDKQCIQHNLNIGLEFIPLVIEDNKVGALTTLSTYLDIRDKMMELYGIKVQYKMDGRKILNLIKK